MVFSFKGECINSNELLLYKFQKKEKKLYLTMVPECKDLCIKGVTKPEFNDFKEQISKP